MKKLLLVSVAMVFLVLSKVIADKVKLWSVREWEVGSDRADCIASQKAKEKLMSGEENIFQVLWKKEEKLIWLRQEYPCIKKITLQYRFPQKIRAEITSRTPFIEIFPYPVPPTLSQEATPSTSAAFLDWSFPSSSDSGYISDEEGVIFKKSQGENLPVLFLPNETLQLGQFPERSLFNHVRTIFIKLLPLGIDGVKGKVIAQYLVVGGQIKMVFDLKKDVERQLTSLQLILHQSKIDEKKLERVDLRFDRPVVVYSN